MRNRNNIAKVLITSFSLYISCANSFGHIPNYVSLHYIIIQLTPHLGFPVTDYIKTSITITYVTYLVLA
jgi:hypothetical protein